MLTSPSGKSYIGQTTRPIQKRLEEHRTGQSSMVEMSVCRYKIIWESH